MADGAAFERRGGRLAELLQERELDLMLVTELTNVEYLTGFTGTNGACVAGADTRLFLTDFRYTERAEAEIGGWDVVTVEGDWLKGLAGHLRGSVGFEDDHMSVRAERQLAGLLEDAELAPAGGTVESLRRVKDGSEVEAIAAAAELADRVLLETIDWGMVGRTEAEVSAEFLARVRRAGAEPSFPPIIASGPNGALPHAEPGERPIGAAELVVFDFGVELDGYCSDGTRTLSTGGIAEELNEAYEVVLAANEAGVGAVAPGKGGSEADAAARAVIAAAGYGENFGHGLGHGVGLEIHEAPRLGPRSEDVLQAGEVVTVEPGIYVPGRFGIRIEDLVVVEEGGTVRNLSSTTKELIHLS